LLWDVALGMHARARWPISVVTMADELEQAEKKAAEAAAVAPTPTPPIEPEPPGSQSEGGP